MNYDRLAWMAHNYSKLVLVTKWQLDIDDRFPSSDHIFQVFTPKSGGNVRLEVEYRLGQCKTTLFAGGNPAMVRMYQEETDTVQFQPSNISRMMRAYNGRNIIIRKYEQSYFDNKIASAVLDAFVEILDKNLEMVLLKVEDLDSPTTQISVKAFYADEVRYIFHSDGSAIQGYYSPRRFDNDGMNAVDRFLRKTRPYEKLVPLNFTDPQIDPEVAMLALVKSMTI